jgi:phosphatidylglycerol:prolipoprotein diacylglycerol transferase
MRPIIFEIGDVTLHYLVLWVIGIFAIIFYSFAQSYGQAKNWKTGRIAMLGLVFIVVGDIIVFFLYKALNLPSSFTVHNVNIYAYGLMLTIAFIIGTIRTVRVAAKEKISAEVILDLVTFIIIGAIIGARLIYVILKPDQYLSNLIDVVYITQGGLSVHGGVIGAMFAALIYTAYRKLSYWHFADMFAPALALGMAIGRIGCFLNGCCYGVLCKNPDAWYAVSFPENAHTGVTPEPRHPAQLYMMALNLIIFFILRSTYKNRKFDGHVFLMWICLYSAARFIQEFYRFEVSSDVIFGFITIAQLASVILFFIAGAIILEMKKRIRMREQASLVEKEKTE